MELEKALDACISNSFEVVKAASLDKFKDLKTDAREITRRWPITEAQSMVGRTRQAIYKAIEEGVIDAVKGQGLSLYQIDALRQHFKTYPYQQQDLNQAVVLAFSGHKGGGWKTSTAVHYAQSMAMKGYRVCLVSADPQGSLNLIMGMVPDIDVKGSQTLLPWYKGEAESLHYCINKTYFPNLDMIPSCLELAEIEDILPRRQENDQTLQIHMLLRVGLETIMDDYDLIVIDGSPNLGIGTVNNVFASDSIVIPTPLDRLAFYSTTQYFILLKQLLEPFSDHEFIPSIRVLATHYERQAGSKSPELFEIMQNCWGGMLLQNPVVHTSQVTKSYDTMRTIYEQSSGERTSHKAHRNALDIFEPVFQEITEKLVKPHWGM